MYRLLGCLLIFILCIVHYRFEIQNAIKQHDLRMLMRKQEAQLLKHACKDPVTEYYGLDTVLNIFEPTYRHLRPHVAPNQMINLMRCVKFRSYCQWGDCIRPPHILPKEKDVVIVFWNGTLKTITVREDPTCFCGYVEYPQACY